MLMAFQTTMKFPQFDFAFYEKVLFCFYAIMNEFRTIMYHKT